MAILLSELYGKEIISNSGKRIGVVEDVIVDFEEGKVANLLLVKSDQLVRSQNTRQALAKNSVRYDKVKSVAETIIVGAL
ncbi:MAG: PRC-barrel domain-containing protein [Candidatus Micrarchaeota archaeon]|nr:PRC-barrel domain-containing protein [Candidatus Micrarchaeota archaeon]